MLGYAPFLGQVGYRGSLGQFDFTGETRKSRVDNRNSTLKSMLDWYSAEWPSFDSSLTARLEAKIDTCRAAILKILSDPDPDIATAAADSCIDDLQRMLKNARAAYWANETSQTSTKETEAIVAGVVVLASAGFSAYHGYKRNNSVGWGIGWGFLGLIFPIITPGVAIIQGYGKRAK